VHGGAAEVLDLLRPGRPFSLAAGMISNGEGRQAKGGGVRALAVRE
jgi:hypothetical protein